MKKILLIILLVSSKCVTSQNLIEYIPENAGFVIGINFGQLSAKSNQMDYAKFLSPLATQSYNYWSYGNNCEIISIKDLFKAPSDYGLSMTENFYYYPTVLNEISGKMYLFSLADAKLFESKLTTTCENPVNIQTKYVGNAKIFSTKTTSVSIKDNVAMIFIKNYSYYDNYESDSYETAPATKYDYPAPAVESYDYNTMDSTAAATAAPAEEIIEASPAIKEDGTVEYGVIDAPPTVYEETVAAAPYSDWESETETTTKKGRNTKAPKAVKEKPLTAKQKAAIAKQEAEEAKERAIQDSIYYAQQEIERAERQKEKDEKTKVKIETISTFMEQFISKQGNSIANNRNLQQLLTQKNDAFAYYNASEYLMGSIASLYFSSRYRSREKEVMPIGNMPLINDMRSTFALNFNNGRVDVNMKNLYSKTTAEYLNDIYDIKQSKKLLKYIDGKNLLGYMSTSTNTEAAVKYYGAFYKEMLSNMPTNKYLNYVLPSLELAYAFIDKDMLFKTFKGQTILACTGFEDIKIKYTTYDYDESYERVEKIEERIEKQPKMIMATSVGEYENAKKLFDIIGQYKFVNKVKDNVYAIIFPSYMLKVNIYIALTKDALIFTNDANLINNHLEGYKGDNELPKDIKTQILASNVSCKIFSNKLMQGIKTNYMQGNAPREFESMLSQIGDFELHDSKPTDTSYGITASLMLNDQSTNALNTLLKMMGNF